eukprot:3542157-Rhodomonas_salina.2
MWGFGGASAASSAGKSVVKASESSEGAGAICCVSTGVCCVPVYAPCYVSTAHVLGPYDTSVPGAYGSVIRYGSTGLVLARA